MSSPVPQPLDQLAEIAAKTFWTTYDPIVRSFGHIEGDTMYWNELPIETRSALITTFKNLLAYDLLRPGPQIYHQK